MGVVRYLPLVITVGLLSTVIGAQSQQPIAVFTEAQAAAGKAAYESVCVNCHTDKLTGRKGDADEAPPLASLAKPFRSGIQQANGKIPALAGDVFMKRWSDRSIGALSSRISVAISGFPPAGLDDHTANNLAAYFLKVTGVTPGARELGTPATMDVLIRDLR